MNNFELDLSTIERMLDTNTLPIKGNEHRMVRVAFDLFRLKGDEAEDLWQVQSSDDGDFLVRTYALPDDEMEVTSSDWSVMADKKCAHFTISYKGVPVKRIDAADHGAENPEDGKLLQGVIFRKLASDANFVQALMESLPREKKQSLQSVFGMCGECEKDEQDAGDYTPLQKQKIEQWKSLSEEDKAGSIPGYDRMMLADLLPKIFELPLVMPGETKVYPTSSQMKYTKEQGLAKKREELAKQWAHKVKRQKEELERAKTIKLDPSGDPLGGLDLGKGPKDFADDPVLAALEEYLTKKAELE